MPEKYKQRPLVSLRLQKWVKQLLKHPENISFKNSQKQREQQLNIINIKSVLAKLEMVFYLASQLYEEAKASQVWRGTICLGGRFRENV